MFVGQVGGAAVDLVRQVVSQGSSRGGWCREGSGILLEEAQAGGGGRPRAAPGELCGSE